MPSEREVELIKDAEITEVEELELSVEAPGRVESEREIHPGELQYAPVVGGEKSGDEMMFTVLVKGVEHCVSVPWPDNPSDTSEPLHRIIRWNDTPLDKMADIDAIPVVYVDNEVYALAPPVMQSKDGSFHTDRRVTLPQFSPGKRIRIGASKLLHRLLKTPLASYTKNNRVYTYPILPEINQSVFVGGGALVGLLFGLLIGMSGGGILFGMIAFTLWSVLGTILMMGLFTVLIFLDDTSIIIPEEDHEFA